MERQLAGGNRLQRGCHGLATRSGGVLHEWCMGPTPNISMKSLNKKTPPEPARTGAEDSSSVDNPLTNIGTKQTMRLMISIPETPTATAGLKLQNCFCGWAKVTSIHGLKIHQGKKGCLKKGQQGSRIDSYFLRSRVESVDRSSAAGHTPQSAGHQHPRPRGGRTRHRRAT